jgi:hypothetical protein
VTGRAFLLIAVNIAVLVVFLVMAANVGALRRKLARHESYMEGDWLENGSETRVFERECPYCVSLISIRATVCACCTREVAAAVPFARQWWLKSPDGSWRVYREKRWMPPLPGNPTPGDSNPAPSEGAGSTSR